MCFGLEAFNKKWLTIWIKCANEFKINKSSGNYLIQQHLWNGHYVPSILLQTGAQQGWGSGVRRTGKMYTTVVKALARETRIPILILLAL